MAISTVQQKKIESGLALVKISDFGQKAIVTIHVSDIYCRYKLRKFVIRIAFHDSPEGCEVGVVGGRGVGDAPLAAGVHVAQVVRQGLQLVGGQLVVVPEQVVPRRLGRPLDGLVGRQEEVILRGIGYLGVDDGAGDDVAVLVPGARLGREHPRLVPLLGHDEGDSCLAVT